MNVLSNFTVVDADPVTLVTCAWAAVPSASTLQAAAKAKRDISVTPQPCYPRPIVAHRANLVHYIRVAATTLASGAKSSAGVSSIVVRRI